MKHTADNDVRVNLKDLDLEETRSWAEKIGLEPYRGEQIRQWIFKHRAESFHDMTTISKELRDYLNSLCPITQLKILKTETSIDGTKKFLFELDDDNSIESVLIPERGHYTVCISSQVGCAMRCSFCLTAKQGLPHPFGLAHFWSCLLTFTWNTVTGCSHGLNLR